MNHLPGPPRTNRALTRRVTELHKQGYDNDFGLTSGNQLYCIQNNAFFPIGPTTITLVDQVYDALYHRYKYLHVVESDCGQRGLLLLDFIHFDAVA